MPRVSRRALKDLNDLPEPMRSKAESLIGRLDEEPSLGKKLLGALAGLRAARLGRSYRIIYRVSGTGVEVVAITPRRDSYR